MRVKIAHPITLDGIAYRPGDVADLPDATAARLRNAGYATFVDPTTPAPGGDPYATLGAVEGLLAARRYDTGKEARDRHETNRDPDGVVLTDSTGAQYALTVSTAGALATTALPKPPIITTWPLFGLHTLGGPASAELSTTARLVGETPSIVPVYVDWASGVGFPRAQCDKIVARGQRPLITWEPFAAGGGATQPTYTLASIIRGDHDAKIDAFAGGLMETNYPAASKVLIRFAHEMNGSWYPWCEAANGNKPGEYVQAWNRVLGRVNNVGGWQKSDFVWCPNAPYNGSTALTGLYPGNDKCSFVGLDAFNFGTTDAYSTWKNPWDTLGPGLTAVRQVASGKAIIVCETACVPTEGTNSQAAWASELVRLLRREQTDVMAFVWFSERKYDEAALGQTEPTDWRLTSSQATLAAMKAALLARRT